MMQRLVASLRLEDRSGAAVKTAPLAYRRSFDHSSGLVIRRSVGRLDDLWAGGNQSKSVMVHGSWLQRRSLSCLQSQRTTPPPPRD